MPLTSSEEDPPPSGATVDTPLAAIAEAVCGPLQPDPVQATVRRLRLYDTVDRRLLENGWRLQAWPTGDGGERWCLLVAGRLRAEATLSGDTPSFADDLPVGPLRDRLTPATGIRALRPGPWIELREQRSALRDDKGKIRCRLIARTATVEGSGERRGVVRAVALKGYEADAARVADRIARGFGRAVDGPDPLSELAGLVHPPPLGTAFPPVTDAGEPAGHALRPVLRALLDTVEQRARGVIADIDSEELHDLRVAVRRSRSILSLLEDRQPELEFARAYFKWLGQVTGRTRDLDVHILAWRAHRRAIAPDVADDLDPLGRYLAAERTKAQTALVRTLRSRRFRSGLGRWRQALDDDGTTWSGPEAMRRPIGRLAGRRIRKLYRRALSEGSNITAESPAEALHALRKTMKKLRYVFEIVREAYARKPARAVLGVFKELQQVLGDVQDMEVQAEALRRFGLELGGRGTVGPGTLMAIGAWAEDLELGRMQARDRFAEVFEPFARGRFGDRLLRLTRTGTRDGE